MAHGQESSMEQADGVAAPSCAKGCGFYGSAATKSMCSKCYHDHLKTIDAGPVAGKIKPDKVVLALPAFNQTTEGSAAAAEAPATPAVEVPAKKAAPTRCMSCKKKVGLLGFACRRSARCTST